MCVCVCVGGGGGGGGGGEQQLKHQGAAPSNSVPSPDELLHLLPPVTTYYHLLPPITTCYHCYHPNAVTILVKLLHKAQLNAPRPHTTPLQWGAWERSVPRQQMTTDHVRIWLAQCTMASETFHEMQWGDIQHS